MLVPNHPAFNVPNKIHDESWKGWVQERGTYFLAERDPRYVDLIRLADPFPLNPGIKTGALVEAKYGKGRWIYIGLGLWRQLPAGTEGAYELLANLLSLGKKAPGASENDASTGIRRLCPQQNFEDAKALFLLPLMRIHYAHLVMLTEQAIVPVQQARTIRDALDSISMSKVRDTAYDGSCEDLFFYLERLLVVACGEEAAGRLHTARSRNDIDMTMYRMQQRGMILSLYEAARETPRRADRPGRQPSRDGVRGAHAHAAGAANDDRSLSPRRHRAAGTGRHSTARRVRQHESESARRLRDHRDRLSDRSRANERAARFRRADRQYLRQHRDG